jgi:hypothetical protein
MLRLNMAIPPTGSPNRFGILGGDLAGFPNGRRPQDDVVAIELRAIAGATIPLVDPSFTPDGAASQLTDGTGAGDNSAPFTDSFPYLGTPHSGFNSIPPDVATSGRARRRGGSCSTSARMPGHSSWSRMPDSTAPR